MKTYHEDRGPTGPVDTKATKAILYPAIGALFLFAIAVETGALKGNREAWMRALLADGGRERLLDLAHDHTVGRAVTDRATRQSARLQVSDDAVLDCHLNVTGNIQAEIRGTRRSTQGSAWMPTAEFQADMDAICGAMISAVIDRSGEA